MQNIFIEMEDIKQMDNKIVKLNKKSASHKTSTNSR